MRNKIDTQSVPKRTYVRLADCKMSPPYPRPDQSLPELSWDTLESSYPNYPKVHELKVREHDMECLMDLAAYVQIGPHVINGEYANLDCKVTTNPTISAVEHMLSKGPRPGKLYVTA